MKRRYWLLAALSLATLAAPAEPAFATSKTLGTVIPEMQAKSNWCWAACSNMIIKHFGSTCIQSKIVDYIYPGENYPNKGGTITQADKAIDHFQSADTGNITQALTWTAVRYQIDNNGPIWAGWSWTNGGGHALVIRGYEDGTTDYVNYVDPAYGLAYKKTYASFKSASDHSWVASIYYR